MRIKHFLKSLNLISIRTRLLLAYGSILLVGFGLITLLAGNQITIAARADYERSLLNEVQLIARGATVMFDDLPDFTIIAGNSSESIPTELLPTDGTWVHYLDDDEVISTLNDYQLLPGTELAFVSIDPRSDSIRDVIRNLPEVDSALSGSNVVIERPDETGQLTFYTAAPLRPNFRFADFPFEVTQGEDGILEITSNLEDGVSPTLQMEYHEGGDFSITGNLDSIRRIPAFVQLSVPTTRLEAIIAERWAVLLLTFALLAIAALIATLWVSRSITQPLYALRKSAIQLAQGDFSHRVKRVGQDEIGAVATAFNEMARQVESMIEEQRAFASNTSHELRTPLTAIRLRSEALRYEPLDVVTSHQYVAEIDDEVRHLGSLIEDLTLLSRFDAGRAELGKSEVDLCRFVMSMTQQMQAEAAAKNIAIQLNLPPKLIPINGSINHLTVAFRNVLDNAIKYTSEGGTITWRISEDIDYVRVVIEDTGQGIEATSLEHVFERFFRADKARSRQVPGTGLGLALVQSIVQAYGGQITVESKGFNLGTTVTICWPYQVQQDPHKPLQ